MSAKIADRSSWVCLLSPLLKLVLVNRIANAVEIAFQLFLIVFCKLAVISFAFHLLFLASNVSKIAAQTVGFFLRELFSVLR
jgi:hypothetical protein